MKLVKIAPNQIVNLECIASAVYSDGKLPGSAAKLRPSLDVVYQFGKLGSWADDAATELWEALVSNCEPGPKE